MTQLVFALVVMMGAQTISVEHWAGIDTCLQYAKKLNSQHVHYNGRHDHSNQKVIHAQCMPVRVDPRTTEIFMR